MARKTKKELELFTDGREIVDANRKVYTIEQAKALWESGKVTNFNMSFHRLATRANWDFDELKRQYAEMDKARGF